MVALPSLMDAALLRLGWTSLQAVLLIGAIALICRQLPRLSAATRSLLWWLVGLQLLLGLALPTPVALPLLSPPVPVAAVQKIADPVIIPTFAAPSEHRIGSFGSGAAAPAVSYDITPAPQPMESSPVASGLPWRNMLLALWLAGVLVQLVVAARHWREARDVLGHSDELEDAALQEACRTQARSMGLRRCPSLRVSHAIRSPQVSGWWRPVVLLPADRALTDEETTLALAHELAHLRRGDLWLGWVPAIAQRVFFFHPLVAWAMREYALNREAACDAQVMQRHDAAPQDYGRLLLRLGVAHPLHAGLAGASPTFLNLKRRLTMLQGVSQGATSRLRSALLIIAVAAAGVLPYRVTQAAAESPAPASSVAAPAPAAAPAPQVESTPKAKPVVSAAPAARATPATAAAPAATAAPAAQAKPAAKAAEASASRSWMPPAPPPVPAAPPAPPAPPTPVTPTPLTPPTPPTPLTPATLPTPPAPPAPPTVGLRGHHVDIDIDSEAKNGFALFDDKANSIFVNGTRDDINAAKRERKGSESMLWFRRGSQAYVVRDNATIDRARAAYAPMRAIAEMQGQIAGQQSRIASMQNRLASRENEIASQQNQLAARHSEMDAQRAQLESQRAVLESRPGVTQADLREMDTQMRLLDNQIRTLSSREHSPSDDPELQHQQQELDRQERELEHQEQALEERERSESGKAGSQMDRLLDEAIAKGMAKPTSLR